MTSDVRVTVGATGVLLLLAGVAVFLVPAVNVWPWALLFFALGGGLVIGGAASANAAEKRAREGNQQAN